LADPPFLHAQPQLCAGGEKGELVGLCSALSCPDLAGFGSAVGGLVASSGSWREEGLGMAVVAEGLHTQAYAYGRALSVRGLVSIFTFPSRVHKMLTFERAVPLVYLCQ